MACKTTIQRSINHILFWKLRCIYRLWRKINRQCDARHWSNDELGKFADLFSGDIVNISAGDDRDKEKNRYRNYFKNSNSYTISNHKKEFGAVDLRDEIELDLSIPLPCNSKLISRFDVVFSHTVLEHVYDIKTAVRNLCTISKDIVITVVPFIQPFHHDDKKKYHDYWRISPYAMVNLFNEHNLKTIYISWNNDPIGNIYLFHIASKHPEKWSAIIDKQKSQMNHLAPGYRRQSLFGDIKICPHVIINDDLCNMKGPQC